MSTIINRFSDPDKQSNRADPKEYYTNIPAGVDGIPVDANSPLTFIEWLKYQTSIDPNSQYALYLQYITKWYGNAVTSTVTTDILKESYLSVLNSLSLVFRDDIRDEWVRELDFTSDIDVEDAIEFYSRKLKEIAVYYINKRSDAQNTKLKYNLVGSERGLAALFEDYILKAFTKRDNVLNIPDQDTYETLPALSSISDNAKIVVEQYYDVGNYFDKSPTVPVSSYFDTDSNTAFTSSIGISAEDLFSLGILDSFTTTQLQDSTVTLDLSSISDPANQVNIVTILNDISNKFAGAIKNRLEIYETLNNVISTQYDINAGNNWFYWPSGEYVFEQESLNVDPIEINSTELVASGATSSEEYETSDKMFVTIGDTTEAAWLKFTPNTTTIQTMSAAVAPGAPLLWKFPYAGYGEASDTLPWTGPALTNINALYNFLDSETRAFIEQAYFTDTSRTSAFEITPIDINETSLVDSGAIASSKYVTADKIIRRVTDSDDGVHDINKSSVYNDTLTHSWLYNFNRTNLSLPPGQTSVFWPYITFDQEPGLTFSPAGDTCASVALSAIIPDDDMVGTTAGRGLYDSDTIYKLDGVNGRATRAAFLQGPPLTAIDLPVTKFIAGADGTAQPGIFTKCAPGLYSTFMWCGSTVSIDTTDITYHAPTTDSEFLRIDHKSIYDGRNKTLETVYEESVVSSSRDFGEFGQGPGIGDWKTDESRTVLFSPIGHTGNTYDEYDNMADIVFLDWNFPEPFSFNTWRGEDGLDYTTSKDFAWYKLDSNPTHPDVGWGPGQWTNYDGTGTFTLSAGMQYKYLRANLRRSDEDLDVNAVPYLVIKESFNLPTSSFNWKDCTLQEDGTWLETTSATPIVVNPTDTLLYDHATTTQYCISTSDTRGFETSIYTVPGTTPPTTSDQYYWVDYETAPVGTVILASWPSLLYNPDSDIPVRTEMSSVTWTLTTPSGNVRQWSAFDAGVPITFEIAASGNYVLQPSGVSVDAQNITSSALNFTISGFSDTVTFTPSGDLTYTTVTYPNIAINLTKPLSGWDSTTSTFTITGEDGKPFWAKASSDSTQATKIKGTAVYGTNLGFFDEYNVRFQPDIDSWELNINDVIEYQHVGDDQLTWVQDVEFKEDDESEEWKQLVISEEAHSLQAFTEQQLTQLVVSATDVASDIILSPYTNTCKDKVLINYFAQDSFTWNQPLSTIFTNNITIVNSSVDIEPIAPYAYLTNRHYPTIAAIPDITNLRLPKTVGIFYPSNLGANVFHTNSYTQTLTTTTSISGTYSDISKYEGDSGFTLEYNPSVISYDTYDAQWMKRGITTIARSGEIVNPGRYQKFIPYINSGEYKLTDNTTINNETDPWTGPVDSTWRDSVILPPDFRGQDKIATWYAQNVSPQSSIYQFCDDVYGNQYYLFKDTNTANIYDQRFNDGEVWCKTIDNEFGPMTTILSDVVNNHGGDAYYSSLTANNIQDIYCFTDLLFIVLDDAVLIEKVKYDYNTSEVTSSVDDSRVISLQGRLFGDVWCNYEDKYIYIAVTDVNSVVKVYKLDMTINELIDVFPAAKTQNVSLLSPVTAISAVVFDSPLMTQNTFTNSYNISLFANVTGGPSGDITDQNLISINLYERYNYFDVKSVDIVAPNS